MNLVPQQNSSHDSIKDQMPRTGPRVSVIIPTRDRPLMLRDAIKSVKDQTFTDYEIIVVINGPENVRTSKTLQVAAGLIILRIQAAGIATALNAGIGAARGRWVAFLDDDDLWEPNRLEFSAVELRSRIRLVPEAGCPPAEPVQPDTAVATAPPPTALAVTAPAAPAAWPRNARLVGP